MKETTKNGKELELKIYDLIMESEISNSDAIAKLTAVLGIFISKRVGKIIEIDEFARLIITFAEKHNHK